MGKVKLAIEWGPAQGGGVVAAGGGWTLRAWPTPQGEAAWAWEAVDGARMRGQGGAASGPLAREAAVAVLMAHLYAPKRAPQARGGSTVAGRGLEGAIEAQAVEDAAAGRCWLWRVPSPPGRGADASARVVDFVGVLPGGRCVAIEVKEGSDAHFKLWRLETQQADILREVDAAGGLAGLVIEVRGRRWWVPWAEVAPLATGAGTLGVGWLDAHGVAMSGADWLTAAGSEVKGPSGVLPWGR
jgi:hypothetical protein